MEKTTIRQAWPGGAAMLGRLAKTRSTARILVRRTAWLTFMSGHEQEHVALVKDISERGVFFYSDFLPALGEKLDFVIEFLTGSDRVRLHLKGEVTRVEQAVKGGAPGVAVSFHPKRD